MTTTLNYYHPGFPFDYFILSLLFPSIFSFLYPLVIFFIDSNERWVFGNYQGKLFLESVCKAVNNIGAKTITITVKSVLTGCSVGVFNLSISVWSYLCIYQFVYLTFYQSIYSDGLKNLQAEMLIWWYHICFWWVFLPMGSKHGNFDRSSAWIARETMLKNNPYLVKLHQSILVDLWTFQSTLLSIYLSIYLYKRLYIYI